VLVKKFSEIFFIQIRKKSFKHSFRLNLSVDFFQSNHNSPMNSSLSLSTSDLVELDKKIEITKVLIIYTGGTIGMKKSKQGYIPESGYLSKQLKTINSFHDATYKLDLDYELITPVSKYDKRANYKILELDPLLDSSNVSWKEVF
jgi:hypothetical protein